MTQLPRICRVDSYQSRRLYKSSFNVIASDRLLQFKRNPVQSRIRVIFHDWHQLADGLEDHSTTSFLILYCTREVLGLESNLDIHGLTFFSFELLPAAS